MYDLKAFRERVRTLMRVAMPYDDGRRPTLADLAEAVGLSRETLSNRLNGTKRTPLSLRDVQAIVSTLASWEAISTQAEAIELLGMVDCPTFTPAQWSSPPLDQLTSDAVGQPLAATPAHHNLPTPLTSFVGREVELSQVAHGLERSRLLTITGVGGAGKTRLALEAARQLSSRFTGGVYLVELAELGDGSRIAQMAASVLGVRDVGGKELLEVLTLYLSARELLLVLDNCEHLLAEVAKFIHQLLTRCPLLTIFATSRERLGVGGEVSLPLTPLALPEVGEIATQSLLVRYAATRLFVERALAANPNFQPTPTKADLILTICQQLDGIPLAIELAAAQLRFRSLAEVAALLADHLPAFSGPRTAPLRQQTLRRTLDWSYDNLPMEEQALLRGLSVFASGFRHEAVAAAFALSDDAVDQLLLALVDKSLLLRGEEAGRSYFGWLIIIRQYAMEKLAEQGEEDGLARQHSTYYLELAGQLVAKLAGRDGAGAMRELDLAHDNMRVALNWLIRHDQANALRLAGVLTQYWDIRGHLSEGRDYLSRALAQADNGADDAARAQVLAGLGVLSRHQGDNKAATNYLADSLSIYRDQGNIVGQANVLHHLGALAWLAGDNERARLLNSESLSLAERAGDQHSHATALLNLGSVAWQGSDLTAAQHLFSAALQEGQQLGDQQLIANALSNLGIIAYEQGDNVGASDHLARALAMFQLLGDKRRIATTGANLGDLAYYQKDYTGATEHYQRSLPLLVELGDQLGILQLVEGAAAVAAAQRLFEWAATLFGVAEARREELSTPLFSSEARYYATQIAELRAGMTVGDFTAAWREGRELDWSQAVELVEAVLTRDVGQDVCDNALIQA